MIEAFLLGMVAGGVLVYGVAWAIEALRRRPDEPPQGDGHTFP